MSSGREMDARSTLSSTGNGAGRPECHTFDDLGINKFLKAVPASGKDFHRKDMTFDRYRETLIKCATRKKRS